MPAFSPSLVRSVRYALVAVIALAGPAIVAGKHLGLEVPRMASIAAASASFVLIALLGGGLRSATGVLMVLGLIGCFMGDVLGPRSFIAGVAAFLVAHLFFIAAYVLRRGDPRLGLKVFLLFALLSVAVMSGLYDRGEGAERAIVVAYAFVISVMVGAAASAIRLPGGRLVFAAAVVFYVSDIAVGYWKFVGGEFPYALVCYPLYYTACTMLAFGVGTVGRDREGEGEGEGEWEERRGANDQRQTTETQRAQSSTENGEEAGGGGE